MYKAIICDDDEIIANGLSRVIPWKELDIEFCGCCYNGADGKKLLQEIRPDILISDIRMPFIDGINLSRTARELNSNIKTVIISGYDEFQYAQEAIRVGAIDYLLKPIDINAMTALLKRAVQECREVESSCSVAESNQKEHSKNMLRALLYEGKTTCENRFGEVALKRFEKMAGMVLFVRIDNCNSLSTTYTEKELSKVKRDLARCCCGEFKPEFVIMEQREDAILGYLSAENVSQIQQIRRERFAGIRNSFYSIYPFITISFVCGAIQSSVLTLDQSYHEASLALGEVFSSPPGSDILYDKLHAIQVPSFDVYDTMPNPSDFISLINQGDQQRLNEGLEVLEKALLQSGMNAQLYLRFYTGTMLSELRQNFRRYGIDEKKSELDLLKAFTSIAEAESFTSAMASFRNLFRDIQFVLENNNKKSSIKAVVAALQYIDSHYMDRLLSMNTVAKEVHISPSYFSVVFSQETGVSFTDYLIALRMRKAQELMCNTDLKVYEISLRVGYDTSAYFSTVFKKEIGMSPSEYKCNHQKKTTTAASKSKKGESILDRTAE